MVSAMSHKITDDQMHSIAQQLIGQCAKNIEDICEEDNLPSMDEWTREDFLALDELAFLCARCGWWVSGDDHAEEDVEEVAGDFVCSECGGDVE